MKKFLKHSTTRKIKIMLFMFLIVSIILSGRIIYDFISYKIPFYYVFFILIWFSLSLFFKNDKTMFWDDNLQKVIKKTEITTFFVILWIVIFRKIIVLGFAEKFNLEFTVDIALIIMLWYFMGRLYFMWGNFKKIFLEKGN